MIYSCAQVLYMCIFKSFRKPTSPFFVGRFQKRPEREQLEEFEINEFIILEIKPQFGSLSGFCIYIDSMLLIFRLFLF